MSGNLCIESPAIVEALPCTCETTNMWDYAYRGGPNIDDIRERWMEAGTYNTGVPATGSDCPIGGDNVCASCFEQPVDKVTGVQYYFEGQISETNVDGHTQCVFA